MGKLANAGQHNPSNAASDYEIVNWYSRPWNAVLRPTNEKLAELSANMAIAAANNNNIIYIWGGQTYHQQLAANNNDPSAIKVQCGTDCMGTVFANIKGAMRRLGMNDSVLPNMGTSNADALLKVGYQKFTDSDHVNTDAHAKRGDVYVNYSLHAAMHVGDGNLNGYSTGTDSSSGSTSTAGSTVIKYQAMSPYIVRIPDTDKSFDAKKLQQSQVCGVALSAGYLFTSGSHIKRDKYKALNLDLQVECATKANMPFALIAEVRAKTVAEAKAECEKLYYVCAEHIPAMSLWLHLDLSSSKSVNNRILDYYVEQCSMWGFKNTLGVYVTQSELDKISWENYSKEKLYLWKVDHSLDVSKYVGVVPFATYTQQTVQNGGGSQSGSSSGASGGADYASATDKQKRIVDACRTTPSRGQGWCAAWVTDVYKRAGAGYPTGNACDMYYAYCKYSSKSDLKVGMLVASPSHSHNGDWAGKTYGHVGIYIGDNKVMQNIGPITTQDLDSWIAYYGNTHTVKWGWGGSNLP